MKRALLFLLSLTTSCLGESTYTDLGPPTILITSPSGGHVSGSVRFSALVEDDAAVELVEFFADATRLSQDQVPPYEVIWETEGLPDGNVLLKVTARDINGRSSFVTKSVIVNNEPD